MKNLMFFLAGLILASAIMALYSNNKLPFANSTTAGSAPMPSETSTEAAQDTLQEHAEKHSNPNYVCPMHPQIVQGEEGSCPICGMDLVLKAPAPATTTSASKKILYWVAPMDANYRRDEPGKSPMGMDLVPVYANSNSNDQKEENSAPQVFIDATTSQNMGVRIHKVSSSSIDLTIQTIGRVQYNEDTLKHVHPRANGWVEKVRVNAAGDTVKNNQVLLEYYSPDIVAAQQDYLISKKSTGLYSGSKSATLLSSARQKLELLNIPKSVIKKLDKNNKTSELIPVLSPQKGVITEIGIRDGMYVTPTTQMYSIADLSSIWVVVDVFEHQMSWVKTGNDTEMTVKGLPGKSWLGKVDYIYPELDKLTRTLRVRLKFDTPEHELKPNMFTQVRIITQNKVALNIPADAIIYYADKPRVIKRTGENTFQPVEVSLGIQSNGNVEILDGLELDDDIVVSGQFMIDSESNLQASFRRLQQ